MKPYHWSDMQMTEALVGRSAEAETQIATFPVFPDL